MGGEFISGVIKNVLELMVMVIQSYECTETELHKCTSYHLNK